MSRHTGWASVGARAAAVLLGLLLAAPAIPHQAGGFPTQSDRIDAAPADAAADTGAQIREVLQRITPEMMAGHVQRLQDFKTRYSYRGDKCFATAEYMASVFSSNGLSVAYGDFSLSGYTIRNVIGQKAGATRPGDIFIICAHYDSIISGASWSVAPGADDNGSGTAAVLAAAELLSDYDFNCTIRFIGFSGEEQGLRGSSNYFSQVVGLGENIRGVINLDMIGYNPDPGSAEVYLGKDFGDVKPVTNERVYGPAPANDTTVVMWLDNTNVINCNLYLQEQGAPAVMRKLVQGTDYLLNLSTGKVDISAGIGPLQEFENITGWYNYSPAGFLIDYTRGVMQRYSDVFTLAPADLTSGSSDHAPFSPYYPAMMLIERRYASNPNYHKSSDLAQYMNFTYCANVTQLAVATLAELAGLASEDNAPPAHTPGWPPDGGYGRAQPCIAIEVTDPSQLNLTSLSMQVNGTVVSPALAPIPAGYNMSFTPPAPYPDGTLVNVSVAASDVHGNGFSHSWEFTVDAVPPQPPSNLTISKARIELVKRSLAINIGSTYDSKHAQSPSVLYKDGMYWMWYAGFDGTKWRILAANSSDGIAWTKGGIAVSPGAVGEPDSSSVNYPTVLFDGEYKMWYAGADTTGTRILYANSTDGVNWVKRGVAINLGSAGQMDSRWAYRPSALKTDEYEMWYSGFDGIKHRILYANSTDGVNWVKHGAEVTPGGSGIMYGDGVVQHPVVAYHGGRYLMYCARFDGVYYRTVASESADGLEWTELGLAIDIGASGTQDSYRADHCSAIITDNETKVWYSAYDYTSWRIMFANATPEDQRSDIALSWSPSPSPDLAGYEVYRESRQSAFAGGEGPATPEYFAPPSGQTPWTFETASESNITVHASLSAEVPQWFMMPDDNVLSANLYLRQAGGAWSKLTRDTDFTMDNASGYVELATALLGNGSTVHAWYNHSAGKALRTSGTGAADVRAGAGSDETYYYRVVAVDRAGNRAACPYTAAKMGALLESAWNLVCAPLLTGPEPVEYVLEGLPWAHARTWEKELWPNQWTTNRPGSEFNNLFSVGPAEGIWVKASSPGAFVAVGIVSDITVNLTAGWNLVAFPYLEIMEAGDALMGLPWDRAEALDRSSATLLRVLGPSDLLHPGEGLWVHVTSDCVWSADNCP